MGHETETQARLLGALNSSPEAESSNQKVKHTLNQAPPHQIPDTSGTAMLNLLAELLHWLDHLWAGTGDGDFLESA